MADTVTPPTADLGPNDTGLGGRTLMTGMGLAAEGVDALKLVGSDLLDLVDATTLRSLDLADGLVTDLSRPLVEAARAPIAVARTAYESGRTGARRALAVA